MAALPSTRFPIRWMDGNSGRSAVFAVLNTTAGDTVDLQEFFTAVKTAVLLGVTVSGTVAASVSGTVVTIPAGPSGDAVLLTVWGVAK